MFTRPNKKKKRVDTVYVQWSSTPTKKIGQVTR